jgi:hypothetical protein
MPRLLWTCALLFGTAWLLPLHLLPWMSWHNEVPAVLALLVGCALALGRHARGPVAVPWIAAVPLLVLAAATLQWLTGRIVYAGSVWTVASYVALCVAALAAGRGAGSDSGGGAPPALGVLAWLLLGLALVQVFIVFAQTMELWLGADWIARTANLTRGGGNVAQPNQAALLFVMAMAATVYLHQRRRFGAGVCIALLLALAAGLATTQSRSAMLGLVVMAAFLTWRRSHLPWRVPVPALALVTGTALLFFSAWPTLIGAYWQVDDEIVNLTSSGRLAMWSQFARAVQERPWGGWGVMQVAEAQNAIAHQYAQVLPATFSHNVLLDLALWIGVPGMLLAVALTVAWLWPRVRDARGPDSWFCIAVAVPFFVQTLTEFPYAYSYILAPVLFALGALDAQVPRAEAGRWRTPRVPRAALALGLAAWTGGTIWAALEYVRIEEDFRVARFEALRVGRTPAAYEAPAVHVLTQLDALLHATRVKPRPAMPAHELALLRNVALLHPWGATTYRYATALALNGHMEEALRQLQVLRATQEPQMVERLMRALDDSAEEYPVLRQLRLP